MYLKTAILILLLYSFTANSTNQIAEKGLASNLGYYLLLEKIIFHLTNKNAKIATTSIMLALITNKKI